MRDSCFIFGITQAYEERRRKKDEDREAQALAEEEEAARKEAERQAVEDAEAEKWLGQISIEAEGNEASEDAEQQVRFMYSTSVIIIDVQ